MVQVSEIETRNKGKKIKIVFDDGTKYLLDLSLYEDRPLRVGDSVDPEEYANWILLHQYKPALNRAVSMLAMRACSKGEIRNRLERAGYASGTVEMVLYKLEKNNLINDQDFAEQWSRYRSGQKYGAKRIYQELRSKGVSDEEAEAAIEAIPEEASAENAVYLARKALRRAKPGEEPGKTRQRMLGALLRRGFSWDQARSAVESVLSEDE